MQKLLQRLTGHWHSNHYQSILAHDVVFDQILYGFDQVIFRILDKT